MNEYITSEEVISIFPNVIVVDATDTAQNLCLPSRINIASSKALWVKSPFPTSNTLTGTYRIEVVTQWKNYSDDPEIVAMSEEEIVQAILSMSGKWADDFDIQEDRLNELRDGWGKRIDDLFGISRE